MKIDPLGAASAPAAILGTMGVVHDRSALQAAGEDGVGLCTIVNIAGSYSRRIGAQLAVLPDGRTVGSLADGCLERQLAAEVALSSKDGLPVMRRFGAGSANIDFRLPCGSGVDVLIDPAPDHRACRDAITALTGRQAAELPLPLGQGARRYIPPARLLAFGEGPELAALLALAPAAGLVAEAPAGNAALGDVPHDAPVDPWTAIVLLYHDHEWEMPLLRWALATPAFLIGAQGGAQTRANRLQQLADDGIDETGLARVTSPIGLIARSREPQVLALSILAQVVGEYEKLHPHG
ncbi:XdhC family protein [Croceibacterium sp. TMG7-5b_MA50]|uniref:XdhC family protein n=1 Tax=Croceibacterium sp. TMG7-5b_MA50 TaxID=3121290 RepID=UPI003222028A